MRTHTCKGVMLMLLLVTPLAQAGTKHYYYTDPQGTVLAKADAQGNIVATYDYAPYGAQVLGTPPSGPAGYTGHVNDPESGFVYMQARHYDPFMARFLSVDPVTVVPGNGFNFNKYIYSSNNPLTYIDPDGRAPQLPLLAQLTYARNYIKSAYQRLMVEIGMAGRNQSKRVSISANATLSGGTGIVGSLGLHNSADSMGIIYLGKPGAELSLDVKYRVFTVNFTFNKESPIEVTAHATIHNELLGGGGELVWNTGGSLSGYLMAGAGVGDAVYAGSVNYTEGEGSAQDNEQQRRQKEWQDRQDIRRIMGFGPENHNYLQ